jgi:hypothetical protein
MGRDTRVVEYAFFMRGKKLKSAASQLRATVSNGSNRRGEGCSSLSYGPVHRGF